MPNALSIANAISRKSRLSISRSLMAWLSGLMFSRGMSQVSAMISATLSNVVDIRPALFGHGKDGRRPQPGACKPDRAGPLWDANAPYSEGCRQVQRRRPGPKPRRCLRISPCAGYRIAAGAAAALALFGATKGANIAPATAWPD